MQRVGTIDRTAHGKGKSVDNRQRFLRRYKDDVREAVGRSIREGDIRDIASGKGKEVRVKTGKTDEPVFREGPGGKREFALPGNKEYVVGDAIPRPPKGPGGGSGGSPDGEGEDEFQFALSEEEFQELFFDGLELPNMVKRALRGESETALKRAGFEKEGAPNRLDMVRTLASSKMRRWALHRLRYQRQKRELEQEREELERELKQDKSEDHGRISARLREIEQELEVVQRKLDAVPFLDPMDARYRRYDRHPVPIAQAVMFCLMDVSGSMGEWEKEIAKRFFMLLYLFLRRSYELVEVVFIRHTQTAKEVDEEEFFRSRETGGTMVSSALLLMAEIVEERFPLDAWNVYAAHASDGENWEQDNRECARILREDILLLVQHFAYVEIDASTSQHNVAPRQGEFWKLLASIAEACPHFDMARIGHARDIYPVFRSLFEPKVKEAAV